MTIPQWEAAFPHEEACAAYLTYLIQHRWPKGVFCPRCDASADHPVKTMPNKWQCYACNKSGCRFSHITGTVFENTNKPLRQWFRVVHLTLGQARRWQRDTVSVSRVTDRAAGVQYCTLRRRQGGLLMQSCPLFEGVAMPLSGSLHSVSMTFECPFCTRTLVKRGGWFQTIGRFKCKGCQREVRLTYADKVTLFDRHAHLKRKISK